ncbi:MAG TPA: citryl-CoA lyase [Allosphingosinicella sp.]|nr:citryl-CoA lyase [Allosphingosinicella sp.]
MRIGRQDRRASAISTSTPETILVRGKDLCGELIGRRDFTSYFWFLVTGVEPDETQRFLADAVLVAIAEHGLVPSVVAARMTHAAAPEAFQGAVAAGLLGCGSVVLGSAELAGRFLADLVASGEAPAEAIARLRAEKKPIPGFGHPLHSGGDPRANLLLKLAAEKGANGPHVAMLRAVEAALPEALGRTLPINVNGAIPAIMLDVGFPLEALKGISLLARTAGLIGHLQEEAERPIGFVLSGEAARAIDYDGPGGLPQKDEER